LKEEEEKLVGGFSAHFHTDLDMQPGITFYQIFTLDRDLM
jgi:uncharacterized protein YbcI